MPTQGAIALSCYGRETVLEEGDFGLSDSFAASTVVLNSTNQALMLAIPYEVLATHVPDPQSFFGLRVPGSRGLGQLVNALLRSVWTQAEHGLPAQVGPQVAHSLLALAATAYALEHRTDVARSSLTAARRAQIKRFIELHLRDTDLNAVNIGRALALSPRYVRMVFAAENEPVSAYVLRRRLDECAKQLCHTLWRGRSITETAFDWGFTSTAYFTRAFKQQFGVTPTSYRLARSATSTAAKAMSSSLLAVREWPP
jgi:AraC-like DNA-binding protein